MTEKMSITHLTEYRIKCVVALARFHYLTVTQMLDLGITSDKSNLSKRVLRPLCHLGSPLIQCANLGGTHLYALTRDGAEFAARHLGIQSVYFPPSKPQFLRDLQHRIGTIDFLIRLHAYVRESEKTVDFCHCYFHNGTKQKGRFLARTRHRITETLFTEADLEFQLTSRSGNSNLFVFEYHRQSRPDRVHLQQLEYHRVSLSKEVIKTHYQFPTHPTILSVYENRSTMATVMKRVQGDPPFQPWLKCFAFATLEDVIRDFSGSWTFLDPDLAGVSPFPANRSD